MKIYIKNMVCDRCILVIENVLKQLDLTPRSIELGEIDFADTILSAKQVIALSEAIEPLGFDLIDNKKSRAIERIKNPHH